MGALLSAELMPKAYRDPDIGRGFWEPQKELASEHKPQTKPGCTKADQAAAHRTELQILLQCGLCTHVRVYMHGSAHTRVHTGVRAREARLGAKYCTHDTYTHVYVYTHTHMHTQCTHNACAHTHPKANFQLSFLSPWETHFEKTRQNHQQFQPWRVAVHFVPSPGLVWGQWGDWLEAVCKAVPGAVNIALSPRASMQRAGLRPTCAAGKGGAGLAVAVGEGACAEVPLTARRRL